MRTCVLRRLVALVLAAPAIVGSSGRAQEPAAPSMEGCPGSYIIGPADVLELAVWGNADMTRTVPVRPDGKISLPLLNDVQAAGLTPMQLRDSVTKALVEYIPEPAVSVIVREIHSFKVTVVGEVKEPGRYELKDRATVLDVLAMAGGLNEYASRDRIVVLRQEQGAARQIPFAYDKLTTRNGAKDGSPAVQDNVCVKPGDVIVIP